VATLRLVTSADIWEVGARGCLAAEVLAVANGLRRHSPSLLQLGELRCTLHRSHSLSYGCRSRIV
jgi:hypothetical protein